jgi:hypothetical protein
MNNKKLTIWLILSLGLIFGPLFGVWAQTDIDPEFNPANIISDSEALNTTAMSKADIQRFLESKNSFLANYYTTNAHGTPNKSAAEIIFEAANNNYDCDGIDLGANSSEADKKALCKEAKTVNPKLILVLLQKEQSLIENSAPSQNQLNWATGYGCPDSWACNPYYQGFGKQVNSAALQFRYYIDHPEKFRYQVGNTYTFQNKYGTINNGSVAVTIANRATAALYNYTPHVFNGNYNFFKLWKRYFPTMRVSYIDGSLLKTATSPGVWLISGQTKRAFLNKGALVSRFDEKKVITVDQSVLDKFAVGAPIKFPNYSLIQTPDKKIFLLVDDKKRQIVDDKTFKKIGFSKDEILPGTYNDLAPYTTSSPITATSSYAFGALLQDKKTGGVFYVNEGLKAPLLDKILLTTKFKNKSIIKTTTEELNKYPKTSPVLLDNGELIKTQTSAAVYLVENGQKRLFASGQVFETMGYNWKNVITVSQKFLEVFPDGPAVTINY